MQIRNRFANLIHLIQFIPEICYQPFTVLSLKCTSVHLRVSERITIYSPCNVCHSRLLLRQIEKSALHILAHRHKKSAELVFGSSCLQCVHKYTYSYHWIILRQKKTFKYDNSQASSAVKKSVLFLEISKLIYEHLFSKDIRENDILGKYGLFCM